MTLGSYYIGIMSGTSLDAIDVVITRRTSSGFQQIAGSAPALPEKLRSRLLQICRDKHVDLQTLGETDQQFALACADAVKQLLKESGLSASQITAVGSHGQTIFHSPSGLYPFTQQIGDAALIAAATGIPCAADFRRMDMAYGGQGAPLVPAFHQALFAEKGKKRVIVNIGGIANISVLTSDKNVLGYDTGPGNMLLDAWINETRQKSFDKNGSFASQGEVISALLAQLLTEPYLKKTAPKSTGREKFNLAWLKQQLSLVNIEQYSDADIQRTLLEFSAVTISEQIQIHTRGCETFVCGGGALNQLLMERLQALLPKHRINDTHSLNIDPMYVEAAAFAWLAEQRCLEKPVPLKAVTGARQDAILGCVYLP
ncbi:anhydro-N-acetylmuramic acid kinase [Psychromonas aquimarina]|uniref:anhydro-N-acetylmuramic acid kinase n=1 Tax=Psychromonas aquimarina TaxID=444919 RepID=UPI00041FFDF9|nr:anhydro-N-acetylmuramic acid kinase [Psychromonas aquimarina]